MVIQYSLRNIKNAGAPTSTVMIPEAGMPDRELTSVPVHPATSPEPTLAVIEATQVLSGSQAHGEVQLCSERYQYSCESTYVLFFGLMQCQGQILQALRLHELQIQIHISRSLEKVCKFFNTC